MAVIRETVNVDPISAERMDMSFEIHRLNFGWIESRITVVDERGGFVPQENGVITGMSSTQLSGMTKFFVEHSEAISHAPSFIPPDVDVVNMIDNVKVNSFHRSGSKVRTRTISHPTSSPVVKAIVAVKYEMNETKDYADAIGRSSSEEELLVESEDSVITPKPPYTGYSVTTTSGVQTQTTTRG